MGLKLRQRIERRIARKIIQSALATGYAVSINDGEETTVKRSRKLAPCMRALFTTDEDRIYLHHDGNESAFSWIYLVYGNDGWDVINDYTTNIENLLKPVFAYADTQEKLYS